jgi:Zn-dependent protease
MVPFRMDRKGWLVVALCILFEIVLRGVWLGFAAGVLLVGCLLFHEVGHMVAAMALGVPVREFGLCAYGAYTRRARSSRRRNEVLISLAGPVMNLLLVFPFLSVPRIGIQLAFCNLTLFVLNLVPLPSSDGLRILNTIRGSKRSIGVTPIAT